MGRDATALPGRSELKFDPETLKGVARALDKLHQELTGGGPGTPEHFREHALLSEHRWGFGDPARSHSVHNTVQYHNDVFQAVERAYRNVVAAVGSMARDLEKTAGNLADSEDRNVETVNSVHVWSRPGAAAPSQPTAPVNPDGSFG